MTTLAEQVAEVKVGDWVEARWKFRDAEVVATGRLNCNPAGELYIGVDQYIRFSNGRRHANLTSITRVPRPIPSEPELFSFALTEGRDIVRKGNVRADGKSWHVLLHNDFYDWPKIYPHITRLYTPSGDLVEGFEYAKGESNG